jgi:cobalt-zinc-cadmium efflux system membrane fusion protein
MGAAVVVVLFALLLWGCGRSTETLTESDPHAGHNHAPGEHEDRDPHAGHNHPPGAHPEAANPGQALASAEDDWCAEHAVPESACTMCHPELREKFQQLGDWCAEHGLPESHCRLCRPELTFPREARVLEETPASVSAGISVLLRSNTRECATNNATIQFAQENTAARAGLTAEVARAASREVFLEAPAETVFDETRSMVVATTVPAAVVHWHIEPGEQVVAGQILAEVQSPTIAELQSKLISARAADELQQKEVARHEKLKSRNLVSVSDYDWEVARGEQTRAELESCRGLLLAAGLQSQDLERIMATNRIANTFYLRAPGKGVVVERIARLGELLDPGHPFALLADPQAMWIEARLTEEQLRLVHLGQTVTFASDGYGIHRVGGKVIWVSRFLDPHTRTGTLRAAVADPQHQLRAGEFGRVTLVPKTAVQWEGCCNVVFVEEAPGRYRPRKIEFGPGPGPYYQVSSGVVPGERVVVDGAFLLKTELTKTSLGAGCCGLEPTG